MRKHYISPIIFDPIKNQRYPKVHQYGVNWVGEYGEGKDWCLVKVEAADHSALLADPELFVLPEAVMETLFFDLDFSTQEAIKDKLTSLGIYALTDSDTSVGDIIDRVGQALHSNFSHKKLRIG